MSDRELEALRHHGFAAAYRMLGSVAEAEDVVQEALLRLTRHAGSIEEPAAWITTVVTRLSINVSSPQGSVASLMSGRGCRSRWLRTRHRDRSRVLSSRTRCPWRGWCCSSG
jgi:hypothetical protein